MSKQVRSLYSSQLLTVCENLETEPVLTTNNTEKCVGSTRTPKLEYAALPERGDIINIRNSLITGEGVEDTFLDYNIHINPPLDYLTICNSCKTSQ
jgi:hypothetical protein